MKVYIKVPTLGAGLWIYEGYANAWKSLGYEVCLYKNLEDIKDKDYYLMAVDGDVKESAICTLENSRKTFLFVQPVSFYMPWGRHPNFISACSVDLINKIKDLPNLVKWSFGDDFSYHGNWGSPLHTVPLAFDNINYRSLDVEEYNLDVCFVGGWANNGFDEKRHILKEVKQRFESSGLRCGIFIGQNIPNYDENYILQSSKVALNVHDAYQRVLGFDTNERTFKSLGANGILISDSIKQLIRLFPDVKTSRNTEQLIDYAREYCFMSDSNLLEIKQENKKNVLENHTYTCRVKKFLSL